MHLLFVCSLVYFHENIIHALRVMTAALSVIKLCKLCKHQKNYTKHSKCSSSPTTLFMYLLSLLSLWTDLRTICDDFIAVELSNIFNLSWLHCASLANTSTFIHFSQRFNRSVKASNLNQKKINIHFIFFNVFMVIYHAIVEYFNHCNKGWKSIWSTC